MRKHVALATLCLLACKREPAVIEIKYPEPSICTEFVLPMLEGSVSAYAEELRWTYNFWFLTFKRNGDIDAVPGPQVAEWLPGAKPQKGRLELGSAPRLTIRGPDPVDVEITEVGCIINYPDPKLSQFTLGFKTPDGQYIRLNGRASNTQPSCARIEVGKNKRRLPCLGSQEDQEEVDRRTREVQK